MSKTFYEQELDRLANTQSISSHHYVRIRQSKNFMEQYYSEKITLKEISSAAYMSEFHYIRIFQQVYGMSPRRFLRDIRINKAKALLSQGIKVSEVCTAIGYESLPTFSKAFKRGTGYSPNAFIKIRKSNLG